MSCLRIFAGSSSQELGRRVCSRLEIPLSPIEIYHYHTGCFEVALEENVRGCRVFIIQTAVPDENLLHRHMWELFQMVNAAKKASAKEITVIIPHFGYDRSDKIWRSRMTITGKIFADFLELVGMDRIVGLDFHSQAFQGFFHSRIRIDHLSAITLLGQALARSYDHSPRDSLIILPGDRGFEEGAEEISRILKTSFGIVKKKRIDSSQVVIQKVEGNIVGKHVIIVDDEVCTAGTAVELANYIQGEAKSIGLAAIHAPFSGDAIARLKDSAISKIIVTDSVPIQEAEISEAGLDLEVISVVPLLARAIEEIHREGSISKLFTLSPEEY